VSPVRDEPARTRIRDDHDANLFIEAGAGTGKTTALVERIVALVAAGDVELRHLAAITFTEAAAAELRDRVRAGLEHAVAASDGGEHTEDARARCRRALDQLDDAALTTLHGFASRLLSEHPFDLGLPPGFRVLDPIEASVDFEQHWSALVDEVFSDPALEPALTVWLAAGLTVARLRPVAVAFSEHHDRIPDAGTPPQIPPLRSGAVLEALDALLAIRRRCHDDTDKLAAWIDGYAPARDALAAAVDDLDVFDALQAVRSPRGNVGRKECWDDVDAARAALTEVERVRSAVLDEQRRGALALLTEQLTAFARGYADERRREGRLWFHDLLVLARDLLRDHADARRAAASRYRCLLIDEFQDTDPLQIELAVLLATSDVTRAARRWSDAPIRDGALTLVGDPKQAIYRFRDADLRVYDEAHGSLDLEAVGLVENFRSAPPILEAVNRVFQELLIERPGVQPAHVALHAHRTPPTGPGRVAVVGEAGDAPIVEIREDEAADVAAVIRQIVDEEWPIERADGTLRPAKARDVALLIPTRTVLPALEAALETADLPVRVESQSLVYSTAEIRDLLHILTAVDDPTDQIAVVASLRSPAYGCSDAELAVHATRGGGWDYRPDPPADSPAGVADGLASLRDLWRERWWRTVSGTVDAVVRERRLFELAARNRRPRDHWRRIRFLLDQARAWEDAGETSLRGFVEWAGRQADEGVRVNEAVAPEPDDPAVRILTVHGAKGLEFPIVVLAGLNTIPPRQPPTVVWSARGPELRVGVKAGNRLVVTDGYDEASAAEREREDAERLRLLYVAMTRARDHLVVSLHRKDRRECHAASLAPHLSGVEVLTPASPVRVSPGTTTSRPASADPADRTIWVARREALLARASVPTSVAATSLTDAADALNEDEERPPWRRGRAGTAIGRAVHAVLQTVDLATGEGLDVIARAQAFAEEVPDREAEVRALAASVLAAPTVREAAHAGWPCWRELPVGAMVDGVLLEGFVDLLVRTPDGLVVVDYKTDRAPGDDELDARAAHYTPQGAAYALALQEVLHEPVVRCVFVFALPPVAAERAVIDLPGALRSVRAQLREPRPAA